MESCWRQQGQPRPTVGQSGAAVPPPTGVMLARAPILAALLQSHQPAGALASGKQLCPLCPFITEVLVFGKRQAPGAAHPVTPPMESLVPGAPPAPPHGAPLAGAAEARQGTLWPGCSANLSPAICQVTGSLKQQPDLQLSTPVGSSGGSSSHIPPLSLCAAWAPAGKCPLQNSAQLRSKPQQPSRTSPVSLSSWLAGRQAGRLTPGVPGGSATAQAVTALPRAVDQAQGILALLADRAVLQHFVQELDLLAQKETAQAADRGLEPPPTSRLCRGWSGPGQPQHSTLPGRCSPRPWSRPRGSGPVLQCS